MISSPHFEALPLRGFKMVPSSEHILDWFHITMRITVMQQYVKGLAHHNAEDA
tara:strand:+ start:627 stop:785 length:159 start_codon:yes stop_codon:yes gene_type:complete